jgi:hypothetical protein
MADATYSKQQLISGAVAFFGVEPYVAAGALYAQDNDTRLTLAAAQVLIETFLGVSITPPTTPSPTPTSRAVRVYVGTVEPTGTDFIWFKADDSGDIIDILRG